ncbi:hypothetical protein ACTXT7_006191 [Hymenolepis weldensis]
MFKEFVEIFSVDGIFRSTRIKLPEMSRAIFGTGVVHIPSAGQIVVSGYIELGANAQPISTVELFQRNYLAPDNGATRGQIHELILDRIEV